MRSPVADRILTARSDVLEQAAGDERDGHGVSPLDSPKSRLPRASKRTPVRPTTQNFFRCAPPIQADIVFPRRSLIPSSTIPSALELTLDPIHHDLLPDIHNFDERSFIRRHFLVLRFLLLDPFPVIRDGLFRVPLDVLRWAREMSVVWQN